MRRFLGVGAIVLVATIGSSGVSAWAQRLAQNDLDKASSAVRGAGGSMSPTPAQVSPPNRTSSVPQPASPTAATPPVTFKVGRFTAEGLRVSTGGKFEADRIELGDFEVSGRTDFPAGTQVTYAGPKIEIIGYSGPLSALQAPQNASATDLARVVLERFAAMSARSISIPTLTVTMTPPANGSSPYGGPVTATYSDLAMRNIHDGHVGRSTAERLAFSLPMPPNTLGQLSATIEKMSVADFDANAVLALLDPAKAKEDRYLPIQGQSSIGSYTINFGGGGVRIDGISLDDIAVRPSKFGLMALAKELEAAQPGRPASPEQARAILEAVASMYEGVRIGLFEIRGMHINVPPDGVVTLGAFRLSNLENGKLAEFAIEGVEAMTPQKEPVRIGRFALKGLDVANLMRATTLFVDQKPDPAQLIGLLSLLEGGELRNLTAPYKKGGDVTIDLISASWGKFIGSFPTAARLTAKLAGPIDKDDQDPFNMLADAGFTRAAISLDLGAAWTEATRSLALTPIAFEVANLMSASMEVSVGNVTREVFSGDPLRMTLATALIEAGPIELTLRDAGAIELSLKEAARKQSLSEDAVRQAFVDDIRQASQDLAQHNADVTPAADAVVRFVQTPRHALVVKLTPKARLPVMRAIEVAKDDPLELLSRFNIEARVIP